MLEFEYREDTNDWNTLTASLTEDEYKLKGLKLSGHAVDVGGYLGSVGIALAADHFPDLTVTIIEPVPDNRSLIVTNIALNGLGDQIKVIWGAAGRKGRETARIHYGYRGNEHANHHAFVGNVVFLQGDGPETCPQYTPHDHADVNVYSLEDLLPADFIKIDCEGGEWDFMANAPVEKVARWIGEWHPTNGHTQADFLALLPGFDVTFDGPEAGPQEFTAVRR